MVKSFTANTLNEIIIQNEEYGVQRKFHNLLETELNLKFKNELKSDGYGVNVVKSIYLLTEFKKELDLQNNVDHLVLLLVQITYQLRKMWKSNFPVNVIMGADRNDFFVMSANNLVDYFDLDIDWDFAPSKAYTLKNELYYKLKNNVGLHPNVMKISFDNFEIIKKNILEIAKNGFAKIKITPDNFPKVLPHFKNIFSKNYKINTNVLANLLGQIISNPQRNDISGVSSQKIITTDMLGAVPIKSRESWNKFWMMYEKNYNLEEKKILIGSLDRIIDEEVRRKQGEFFTPRWAVREAHRKMAKVFGQDWKEKYFVWDCAWGTGNLTRDEKFNKLFVTTLHNSDIITAKQSHFNDNVLVREVFDFLNHPDEYIPQKIKDAIERGQEIIFLINPPYATSNVAGNNSQEKSGTSQTEVNKLMKQEGLWGKSVQQLYTQFLWRILRIPTKTHIGIFSKPTFLTGDSFQSFRKEFLKYYEFKDGFVMDAQEFADVKSWPLTFSIFENVK
jgi:hypothetical protein